MQRKSNRIAESVIVGAKLLPRLGVGLALVVVCMIAGSLIICGCAAFMEGFGAGLGGAAGGITKHVPEIADAGLNGGLITAIVTAGIAAIGGGGLGVRRILRKRKEKNGNA